ncbi:hypothetical protein HGRIS_011485 [Hohenbuehelia grisea]|uniref:RING-type domain-containing protein n=1 Tax=Hohenbuehelia grisea TaxID=104357 RepID=A0ABR3JVA6_9AGAR
MSKVELFLAFKYLNLINIPDYPPPSFEEAISTPPMSACASTTTLANTLQFTRASSPLATLPATSHSAAQSRCQAAEPYRECPTTQGVTSPQTGDSLSRIDNDTTSAGSSPNIPAADDDSQMDMEIIEPTSDYLADYRSRARMSRVRLALGPDPAESTASLHDEISATGMHVRGRTRRPGPVLDLTTEGVQPATQPCSALAKRRHLSLSPLRTLFPSKTGLHDRSQSVQPSPISPSSPISPTGHRSAPTLKTSFSTVSLGFFTSHNGESSSLRQDLARIFSHKGKERPPEEPFDEWEVVDGCDGVESPSPISLCSAMEAMRQSPSPFEDASAVTATHPPSVQEDQEQTFAEPSVGARASPPPFTSYREEKVRAIFERPARRNHSPPVQTQTPSPPSPSLAPSATSGFPSPISPLGDTGINNRERMNTAPGFSVLTKRIGHTAGPSPLSGEVWRPDGDGNVSAAIELQRAMDTPLPDSPVGSPTYFDYTPRTPIAPASHGSREQIARTLVSPTVPWRTHYLGSRSTTQLVSDSNSIDVRSPDRQRNHGRTLGRAATINPVPTVSFYDPPLTPSRHHYRGRPLPRPPPGTPSLIRAVDSVYASSQDDAYSTFASAATIFGEEGHLIDLDDDASPQPESSSASRLSTPLIDFEDETSPPSPELPFLSLAASSSSTLDREGGPETTHDTSRPVYGEVTELDVLASRLNDSNTRDGTDYDTLLLLSEFIGPATHTSLASSGPAPSLPSRGADPEEGEAPLQGRIEVKRRRKTRDGKQKIKLSLLGVDVNKCAICMSQFREGELADMGASCQHAFHAVCLGQWRGNGKRTCPLCRATFG